MTIFIITILLGWMLMAFAPSLLRLSGKKERRSSEKSFRPGASYRVQTYKDFAQEESGPASVKPIAAAAFAAALAGSASSDDIRHITFLANDHSTKSSLVSPAELTIVDHNFILKDGRHFTGNISVNGTVRLGSDSRMKGAIKSTGSVIVSQDSTVVGDIESGADIRIEAGASVSGSLKAAGHIWIYENARVGEPSAPCTIRGNEVVVAPTSRVHGSIWAQRNGVRVNRGRAA